VDRFSFGPDADRGRAIDGAVRDFLARSLTHIADACRGTAAADIADVLATVPDRRIAPAGFGQYYQLAECLLADDLAGARAAARALADLPSPTAGLSVHRRGAAGPLDATLDLRMGAGAARFHPLDAAQADDFAALLRDGLALLDQGAPALAGEIRAILTDILLAQAPPGAKTEFDGASHYQFWGLVLLNPRHHRDRLAVAEVLAHEAGHSLLFGLTLDEPLVLNPDDELFASPLRVDPRPMDGIYHATFVSARMAWAMETLATSGVLSPDEVTRARVAAAQDRANFAMGVATVRAHGRLSATGAAIMDATERAVTGGWA
jgi:HEXXH motif-containing protein